MATAHFNQPPAKRVKVQSDNKPEPILLLVPAALRTVQDLLKYLLLRLRLPTSSPYDLCLDGAAILPDEDIALIRDDEKIHLRQRHAPSPPPKHSQLDVTPPHTLITSSPENAPPRNPGKRKRLLTPDGKRRRNARNRKREKRRRLERRPSPPQLPPPTTNTHDDVHPSNHPHMPLSSRDDHPPPAINDSLGKPSPPTAQKTGPSPRSSALPPKYSANAVQCLAGEIQQSPVRQTKEVMSDDGEPESHPEARMDGRSSLPVTPATPVITHQEPAPRHGSEANGMSDERKTSVAPESGFYIRQQIKDDRRRRDIQRRKNSELASSAKPSALLGNIPESSTKAPPKRPYNNAATCPDLSSKKLYSRQHSYVFLQHNVSVDPFVMVLPQKRRPEEGNEPDKPDPHVLQDCPAPRLPANDRLAANHATTGHERELRSDEATVGPGTQTAGHVPSETREATSACKRHTVEEPYMKDCRSGCVASPDRSTHQVKKGERNQDAVENDDEFSVPITNNNNELGTSLCPPMTSVSPIEQSATTASLRLAVKDATQEAPEALQSRVGDLKDQVDQFVNMNPRWRRRRPQGNKVNCDKPESGTKAIHGVQNDLRIPSPHGKDAQADELQRDARASQLRKAEASVAQETVTRAKSSERNVINLVDEDEAEAGVFDTLPVFRHSPTSENRPASTSPQSIVVSPADPPSGNPVTSRVDAEISKKCSPAVAPEEVVHRPAREDNLQEEEPRKAPASRRKPKQPKRLNKPTRDIASDPNTSQRASSTEISRHKEKELKTLEMLKQAVVKDLQTERQEKSLRSGDLTLAPVDNNIDSIPESSENPHVQESANSGVRNDTRKKRNAMKGGLSTLAALRVARAHGAIASSAPKDRDDSSPENNGTLPADPDSTTARGTRGVESDLAPVKDTFRKKRKRSKRSRKAQLRYMDEEQVNRSIFVGYEGLELLLPPPGLLDLPEASNDFIFGTDVPANLAQPCADGESRCETPAEPPKGAQPASQSETPNKTPDKPSFPTTAPETNQLKHNQSLDVDEPIEKDHSPLEAAKSETDNAQSTKQQAALQNRNDTDGEWGKDRRGKNFKESSLPKASLKGPQRVDHFREDLFEMLQHTTRTLAETWSKWEGCQYIEAYP